MSDTNDQSSEKYNPFTAYLAAKAKQSRDLEKQMGARVFGRLPKHHKKGGNS